MLLRFLFPVLAVLMLSGPAFARAPHAVPKPRPKIEKSDTEKPKPESRSKRRPSLTDIPDMSKAVPASQIGNLPTTAERYRALKAQVEKAQPAVQSAKSKSEALKAETATLQRSLIQTAERVQYLEQEKMRLDARIATLSAKEQGLSKSFARDRLAVAHLLALLERLQHDTPPPVALTAADALSASRGAILLGASLPRVYGAAAALARRLDDLRRTRAQLVARRAESARNAAQLASARTRLDQLLATKKAEADTAVARYDKLAARFDVIAKQATDLNQLLQKVAGLRAQVSASSGLTTMGTGSGRGLRPGGLRRPVVGRFTDGGIEGVGGARAPGVTFSTQAGAQVVAPADSKVLFAGRYHKTGQVLILEMAGGYDLVLAGLDRVEVHVGDQLLAGEPLGTMPDQEAGRLYFELRHDGKGMSPAPWLETGLRKAERS